MVAFTRRASLAAAGSALPLALERRASAISEPPPRAVLPLELSRAGVPLVRLLLGGGEFVAAVDTGSPFLIVPAEEDCDAQPPKLSLYGCVAPGDFTTRGGGATREVYGKNVAGRVAWYRSQLRFADASSAGAWQPRAAALTFGAADRPLVQESGALLGLIKRTNANATASGVRDADRRPTALAQLGLWPSWATPDEVWPRQSRAAADGGGAREVVAYRLDANSLTLSAAPLLAPTADALPLVDLRRYGDSVEHVAVAADGVVVDGVRLRPSRRPIFVVFDSGLTSIVVSRSLAAEAGLDPAAVRSVAVEVRSERGARRVLRARDVPGVQVVPLDWFDRGGAAEAERPHVIALGMALLGQGALTVDVDAGRADFR